MLCVQVSEETLDNFFKRMLHLLEPHEIDRFVNNLACILQPRGIIVISTRNEEDFKPLQMRWINKREKLAAYTLPGRAGHFVRFWGENKFRKYFSEKFEIYKFTKAIEQESIENQETQSYLTIMVARKKKGIVESLNS